MVRSLYVSVLVVTATIMRGMETVPQEGYPQASPPVASNGTDTLPPLPNSEIQVNGGSRTTVTSPYSETDTTTMSTNTNNSVATMTESQIAVDESTDNTNSKAPLGIDQGDDGMEESLADYAVKKIGELIHGKKGESDKEEETELTDVEKKDCNVTTSLDAYCGPIPEFVRLYFNNDTSLTGVLSALFSADVLAQLSNCTAGSWCLPDSVHQMIREDMVEFYTSGPFCSDAMWSCLDGMLDLRYECDEKPLRFLVSTVLLLCDIQSVDIMTAECYAATKEALYVTYMDIVKPNEQHELNLEESNCNDYSVQMATTYMHAHDACMFNQSQILERFEPWEELPRVADLCNITREIQEQDEMENLAKEIEEAIVEAEEDEEEAEEEEDLEPEEEEEKKEEEKMEEQILDSGTSGAQNENGMNAGSENDSETQQDRFMLFALVGITTLGAVGLLSVALVGCRRFRMNKLANYRRGYSKLTDEESKMLKNEYK